VDGHLSQYRCQRCQSAIYAGNNRHEWTHEYLAFTPLGSLYLLDLAGITHNPDIVTMNETVADTVGKEIGAIVYKKYYDGVETNGPSSAGNSAFDFNQEMRDIRKSVDGYLARGEIEAAENFMREKRDFLATKGYYIRKLEPGLFCFQWAICGYAGLRQSYWDGAE